MTSTFFAIMSGFGVTSAYTLIGASWLILKTENELQNRAIQWCKAANKICFIGVLTVSILNLFVNSSVFQRWFEGDIFFLMLPLPLICFCLFILMNGVLNYLQSEDKRGDWLPLVISVFVFVLCYFGLVYSFYPYIIPNKLTIFDALAAEESLNFLFYGVVVVVPTIILYTLFLYKVFWGKVKPLSYY